MAPLILTEDDIYRTSTQYRLWSFTPETLASLRETNRKAAAEQVSGGRNLDDAANTSQTIDGTDELTLLAHHTRKLLRLALTQLSLPTPVAATGAVYLKRFYLSHSLITYPPQLVMPTCLFLATKTEHYYVPLSTFAKKWKPELQPEDVLREEGTVTQALRFCFDVKHPFRGLRGALIELRAMADGVAAVAPGSKWKTAQDAQDEMLNLPVHKPQQTEEDGGPAPQENTRVSPKQAQARAFQAHDRAKEILASAALLSDACFLYTPAQMMFAALLLADEPLALFYLAAKLPTRRTAPSADGAESTADDATAAAADAFNNKLTATIRACADLLSSVPAAPDRDAIAVIERKLEHSRQAYAAVESQQGSKRNGGEASDGDAPAAATAGVEKSAKKRKLHNDGERSPFGGPLTDSAASLGGSET